MKDFWTSVIEEELRTYARLLVRAVLLLAIAFLAMLSAPWPELILLLGASAIAWAAPSKKSQVSDPKPSLANGQRLRLLGGQRCRPGIARQAGIDKRVHAHGLRHTMATEMVERGIALHVIAGQLGHSSTATTDTYLAKLMPDERIKAMRAAGWELDSAPSEAA